MKKIFYSSLLICISYIAISQEYGVMLVPDPLEIIRSDSSYVLRNMNNTISFSQLDTAFFDKEMNVYVIKRNQKWGAVSEDGIEVLACKYDSITYLSRFYAKVCKNKKWGVASTNHINNIVVPIEFDSIYNKILVNYYIVVEKDGLLGLHYEKGQKLLDCKYSSITPVFYNILELKENNKVKYYINNSIINDSIDFSQTMLIANNYQNIKAYYVTITAFGKGVINKNGRQIIPAKYNQILYKERITISSKEIRINNLYIFIQEQNAWGAYNIETKETTPCTYASIEELVVALNLPIETK
ncbi:MAG TPA: WG repeat-containing protein [Bacteroidales bacterium]|nr:WG repeat-containing protein [Bacteroidales bacterium]